MSKEKRMGLRSMEERVRLLSGTFALRSEPGKGDNPAHHVTPEGGLKWPKICPLLLWKITPLFREGLKAIIANDKTLTLLGEAGTVHEGFQKVKEFRPDVAIVDLSLPDGSGIDLTRDIREKISGTRILVLTHGMLRRLISSRLWRAGALGYIRARNPHRKPWSRVFAPFPGVSISLTATSPTVWWRD